MNCDNCGKEIGFVSETDHEPAYQVRVGYFSPEHLADQVYGEFIPDEDIGYYCSECLSKGV